MPESILNSTKKALGLDEEYDVFDPDIIMHINSALGVLAQLGVGPSAGFMIADDSTVWEDLLGLDPILNMAKTYVYLSVRLIFDPPSGPVIAAMEKQKEELVWRMSVHRETTAWVDPSPRYPSTDEFADPIIIDGGVG